MKRRIVILGTCLAFALAVTAISVHWLRRPMFANNFGFGRSNLPDWDRVYPSCDRDGVWSWTDLRLNTILLNDVGRDGGVFDILHNRYASSRVGFGYTESGGVPTGHVELARKRDTLYIVSPSGETYTFNLLPAAAADIHGARAAFESGQLMLLDVIESLIDPSQSTALDDLRWKRRIGGRYRW